MPALSEVEGISDEQTGQPSLNTQSLQPKKSADSYDISLNSLLPLLTSFPHLESL